VPTPSTRFRRPFPDNQRRRWPLRNRLCVHTSELFHRLVWWQEAIVCGGGGSAGFLFSRGFIRRPAPSMMARPTRATPLPPGVIAGQGRMNARAQTCGAKAVDVSGGRLIEPSGGVLGPLTAPDSDLMEDMVGYRRCVIGFRVRVVFGCLCQKLPSIISQTIFAPPHSLLAILLGTGVPPDRSVRRGRSKFHRAGRVAGWRRYCAHVHRRPSAIWAALRRCPSGVLRKSRGSA
jgi:hypothetical protein